MKEDYNKRQIYKFNQNIKKADFKDLDMKEDYNSKQILYGERIAVNENYNMEPMDQPLDLSIPKCQTVPNLETSSERMHPVLESELPHNFDHNSFHYKSSENFYSENNVGENEYHYFVAAEHPYSTNENYDNYRESTSRSSCVTEDLNENNNNTFVDKPGLIDTVESYKKKHICHWDSEVGFIFNCV